MKKSYLFILLFLLPGIFLSLWSLSCKQYLGEGNTLEPKEWFETYATSDASAYNWRQNHVKNIHWEKAVEVKDAFDNEAWEIPVESNMYFGYEHAIIKVNGQEVALADQVKSARKVSPFQVHLLIVKNQAGGFDGRILNYFTPNFDATQKYPNNLNELPEFSDFGINVSEFSGKPEYSLYYRDNGIVSISATSLEHSEMLKAKLPVTEKGDGHMIGTFTVHTDCYQNHSGGDSSTAWFFTNATSQYHIGYF